MQSNSHSLCLDCKYRKNYPTHLVKGATIEAIRGKWWEGDFSSEILDAVSEMGGCRWVLGERTYYDYHEHNGRHYLEVTEIGRQEEEK